MRERWEKGSVIGKPRSLAHRVFPAGFRQRFPHLALRTEPDNRCVVCEVCSMGRTESWHLSEIGDMTQTEADRKPKLSSAGSTPALTFQRTAISGNSFTYSQKFCERHTLVFESQAQNRVHVETALISLRLVAPLSLRRGNILGGYYG